MADCHFHSCDSARGEGDQRLFQLWARCCWHGVHQSPSLVNPGRKRLFGKCYWYLPPLILWLGEGVLDQNKCCSVGIYFHWVFWVPSLPRWHPVQQKKPNSSWFLGVNLEIKGSLKAAHCNHSTLSLQPKRGLALLSVPHGWFLAKPSKHFIIFCTDLGGGWSCYYPKHR